MCDNCSLFVNQSKQEQLGFKILTKKNKNKTITANCYTLTINESQQSHFSLYFYDTVIIICRQRKEYILNFPNNYMPNVLISNLEKQSN